MTFYLATACMFVMYGGCLAFMRNNSRYQHTIMHRLKREVPLDDIVHARVPAHLATTGIRRCVGEMDNVESGREKKVQHCLLCGISALLAS